MVATTELMPQDIEPPIPENIKHVADPHNYVLCMPFVFERIADPEMIDSEALYDSCRRNSYPRLPAVAPASL